MKTRTILTVSILFLFTFVLLPGCQSESAQQVQANAGAPQGTGSGVVAETMDSGGYTYMHLEYGGQSFWIAATEMKVQVGDEVDFEGGSLMKDFRSASLNRTFPYILFAGSAQVRGALAAPAGMGQAMPPGHRPMSGASGAKTQPSTGRPEAGSMPSVPGALTVAEVYSDRTGLSGKSARVVGKVVKVNANIMGTNWIHIQDGTENEGDFDLLVTSAEVPTVGSIITAEGKIAADKDFGAGYFFKVLVEEASLSKLKD